MTERKKKTVQRQRIERKTHTGQKLVHRKIDFVVGFGGGGGGAIIIIVVVVYAAVLILNRIF